MTSSPDNETATPSLYAKQRIIYPQRVKGLFRKVKWAIIAVLLGLYYLIPWIRWDRGPDAPSQAVLVDIQGGRLYFFGGEIWPQEVYYLTGLLIIGAIGLFLVTAIAGRVWCGFTCPQTVWTDLFLFVERLVEGDRNKRIKLDNGPLTLNKAFKKITKHTAWLVIAALTGGAWIWYFNDAFTVTRDLFTGRASLTIYGFVGLFTGTTYLLAGWAREQVCMYMCPWPRFQGAMFDEDSLIVTYETWRGEPRGRAKKGDKRQDLGHCVDCNLCVNVCPMGIDIRDGQQMECIGCALCVDACNGVMDHMDYPRGLITYDSISNQVARETGKEKRFRLLRPRTASYMAILLIVIGVMAFTMATRKTLEINVQRDRSPLFVTLSDGSLRNGYTYKILNMIRENRTFTLSVRGLEKAKISVIGYQQNWVDSVTLPVKADQVGTFRVFVRAPPQSLSGRSNYLDFRLIEKAANEVTDQETLFYGPGK